MSLMYGETTNYPVPGVRCKVWIDYNSSLNESGRELAIGSGVKPGDVLS